MQARYHVAATRQVLAGNLAQEALAEVVTANIGQDSFPAVLGAEPFRHYCDPDFARNLAYIEEEHALIANLTTIPGSQGAQRAAFGRLLHTVQDFYAHTNYVDLWLAESGLDRSPEILSCVAQDQDVAGVDALDPEILRHPDLCTGDWVFWRDAIFYVPLVGAWVRRFWVPPHSHEAMHLDSPGRGPRFGLALAMARQRTREEYQYVMATLYELGGHQAAARFCGNSQAVQTVIDRPHLSLGVPSAAGEPL